MIAMISVAHLAHAQVLGANPLTITFSPQYPAPYQTVTVTPGSTIVDLASASVTISVDGKVIYQGTGSGSASFTAGGPGSTNTVTVAIASSQGNFQSTAVVRASSVALIVEPESTTHPFYEGASQIAIQGGVRLIAMADLRASSGGSSIDPKSLVYNWRIGDQNLQGDSGIGKSSIEILGPAQYRSENVSVTVSTQDGSITGSASTPVVPVDPTILFYEDGPLTGPKFDAAVGNTYSLRGDEASFRAVAYSFPSVPAIAWTVGGQPSASEPVITLRPTGTGAGSAVVSASASFGNGYIGASYQSTIEFGQSNSHSIFGL